MNTDPALAAFDAHFGPEFGHGKAFDLTRLRAVLHALGDPHVALPPIIHVAGTNGKGSTVAFMRAIAEAAGLRVHAFTKPHLLTLNERFTVASATADTQVLIAAADHVASVDEGLTHFDAQVAAAFLLFSETPADLVLLETGMGGRDDSTNVIERAAIDVITPIDLDHQDALGPTLAEIARHKAGILRAGAPAIIARQHEAAMRELEAQAERIGAPLLRQGAEWDAFLNAGRLVVQTETHALDLPAPSLFGAHQVDNAGAAVAALLALNDPRIHDDAIGYGVAHARWAGRMQPLTRGPLAARARGAELWLDAGHNAHAARALVQALAELQRKRPAKTALIIGMRARKDWRAFVGALAPSAACVIAVPLSDSGAAPDAIADAAREVGARASAANDLPNAIDAALASGAERILICGSVLLASEALREARD